MASPPDTVFFLSDYGLVDEFVGVVHAVITSGAPAATVIDLSHHVPAFDIRAGARMLERSVPFLGPGVVLAVIDPGVGSPRRGVVLKTRDPNRPGYFVGPDNGLILAAAERCGGVAQAVELAVPAGSVSATFDGRDLFAPAVAALCRGVPADQLGRPIDPAWLVPLDMPVVTTAQETDGWVSVQTEVAWIDHFGNVALALRSVEVTGLGIGRLMTLAMPRDGGIDLQTIQRVGFFSELDDQKIGLMADANGALSLVLNQGSAAARLGLSVGETVRLTW